ncbi:unnamed protein product, partial [marine sediment metagenome]
TMNLHHDSVLVRSSDGKLIASGMTIPHSESPLSTHVMIQVHPEHRRQGIGSNILKHFLRNGRNQNNEEFCCRVFNFRPYSIAFAMKCGFEHSHTWIKMKFRNNSRTQSSRLSWNLKVRVLDVETELGLWADLQNRIFAGSPMYEYMTVEKLKDLFNNIHFDPSLIFVGEVL